MSGAPKHKADNIPEIEITPEMISAASRVLWSDPFLLIPEWTADEMAEEMLRKALSARHEGIDSVDPAEPSRR